MSGSSLRRLTPGLLTLAGVPALLVGVFLLPSATRTDLVFAYAQPTVRTAFTSQFVHLTAGHLLTNLLVYLLVVPLAYLLADRAGRRELFWSAFVTFLTVLPFVLSGLNLLFVRPRVGFGFSGINMAFLGLLALLVVDSAGRRPTVASSLHHAPGLFFAGTGLIAVLAVPSRDLRLGLAAAATIVAGVYLTQLPGGPSLRAGFATLARTEGAELTVTGLTVFMLVPFAAFPSDPAGSGAVLNLYTHLLGFCIGFIAPYATASITDLGVLSPRGVVSTEPTAAEFD